MQKHHTEDYKISAVKHYLNKSHNLTKTCNEFDCSRITSCLIITIFKNITISGIII